MEPIYDTSLMGFHVALYEDRLTFKKVMQEEKTIPLHQILSVTPAGALVQKITIQTTTGRKIEVPVSLTKKKPLCEAIEQAKAKYLEKNPDAQEAVSRAQVTCPKCGSTQITAQKRGFSMGRALVGGVVGGFIGSKKIILTCLVCGHTFKPGSE